jgi:hypothetical protein
VITKVGLQAWVTEALEDLGGRAHLIAVAKRIWAVHEQDLRDSGNLFFTWQYDMRWAANRLRRMKVIRAAAESPVGVWELVR